MISSTKFLSFAALVSALTLSMSSLAIAQEDDAADESTVDIAAVTCRDFLLDDDDESIAIFLHGYITGKSGETSIDTDAVRTATDRSYEDCIDNPDASVLSVFEQNR